MLKDHHDKDNLQGLIELENKIEEVTTQYDDLKTLYHLTPDLINRLISPDKVCARDFIKNHKDKILDEDLIYIHSFDHYTLEAIMIHVLASTFHSLQDSPAVRVATLVEYLTQFYRNHAKLIKARNINLNPKKVDEPANTMNKKKDEPANTNNKKKDEPVNMKNKKKEEPANMKNNDKRYAIGAFLLDFLSSREVITLTNDLYTVVQYASKKKGSYFYPKSLYAVCNFDLDLLPIKLNLPMVVPPRDWVSKIEVEDPKSKRKGNPKSKIKKGKIKADKIQADKSNKMDPKSMGDLCGGYLSSPTSDFYLQRFNLLSSRDTEHFSIVFEKSCKNLINVINGLQSQAFEINTDFLNFINKNYDELVKSGFLMPKFLSSLNVSKTITLLRDAYLADSSMSVVCTFNELLKVFMSQVQNARYESLVIDLASSYDGYLIFFPCFLDFRGRIYRSGILHFHERDLARSLIVFSNVYDNLKPLSMEEDNTIRSMIAVSAAFHFKKFPCYVSALKWYTENDLVSSVDDESLIQFAVDASNPFQFLSKVICFRKDSVIGLEQIPICQDASASAYQIMSLFLLDHKIAEETNLIYSGDYIRDIYGYFLEEYKIYMVSQKKTSDDSSLIKIISERLTRNLIKSLFMPLIYGKSVLSMANDIHTHYNTILSQKECMVLASDINTFFKEKFPDIVNLMDLVRMIGWVSSNKDKPVFYSTPNLTTVQDYMKSKAVNIWVYDRIQKKKRQVTLRIPSEVRDRKKTSMATFANFIHQQDANIAMCMIDKMLNNNIPVYTVHDNFITAGRNAKFISSKYIESLLQAAPNPLLLINFYITRNLLDGLTPPHYLEIPLDLGYHARYFQKAQTEWSKAGSLDGNTGGSSLVVGKPANEPCRQISRYGTYHSLGYGLTYYSIRSG
jgi:DNA-directed RNA polymerase